MTAEQKHRERCLRMIGIIDDQQLQKIRNTKIAVGGLGLGGSIFINLVRLGFVKFRISDPDVFERSNIGRQRGAKETTIGARKDDTLIQEARSINPDVEIELVREGVSQENVSRFLEGIDWVIDAVDVFAIPAKIALNERARELGLPVVSCVSVGFGAAICVFDKGTPSFLDLTGMKSTAAFDWNFERFCKFATPVVPEYMRNQLSKAMDRSGHIPFMVTGVEISAAITCVEVCKQVMGIGERVLAPHGIYIDPMKVAAERYLADYRARDKKSAA